MQQCSFTEFHNELARVLGTRQHAISKASMKPITTKSVEVEEEEEDAPIPPPSSKSHAKKDKKISMQSSQIKDLKSKLIKLWLRTLRLENFSCQPPWLPLFLMHSWQQRPVLPTSQDTEVTVRTLAKASHFWGSTIRLNYQQEWMVSPTLIRLTVIVRTPAIC